MELAPNAIERRRVVVGVALEIAAQAAFAGRDGEAVARAWAKWSRPMRS